MRTSLAAATAALLGGIFLSTGASAQASGPCPALPKPTASTGCGIVITVTNTGATFVTTGTPFDFGGDDMYVGVVNNTTPCPAGQSSQNSCNLKIYSLDVNAGASGPNICGFHGDGIDYYGAPDNSMDTTNTNGNGYGGPNAYFTNINASATGCRVNFITPIPPGGTSYFSLENRLSSSNACTSILNNSVPEPTPMGAPQITTTFTPQGNDPETGMPYTINSTAMVCGFFNFDWQQLVTTLPNPRPVDAAHPLNGLFNAANAPTAVLATPFNDPPPQSDYYVSTIWGNTPSPPLYNVYYGPLLQRLLWSTPARD